MIKRAPRRHIKLAVILAVPLLGSHLALEDDSLPLSWRGSFSSIFLFAPPAFLASPNNVIVHCRGTIKEEQKQISIMPIARNSDEPVFFSQADQRRTRGVDVSLINL